jgi:hypothetical protein
MADTKNSKFGKYEAYEKKILASRYSGVLTMLPTPGNAAFIT